ncbi:MAG: alanine--glyoxylate aminotransferase family protein [Trueperaceae bacterium]|nr:alanine--glyoxylate aminotransferase family protein [Trueperaceae bacterium]
MNAAQGEPEALRKARLLAPGPVEVPPDVLEAVGRPPLHHRSPAFAELLGRTREGLAALADVPGDDVLVVTGSGTAGFEAAFLAAVPHGAPVVSAHAGKFGARWAELARRYGHPVTETTAPWGACLDPEAVARAVRDTPGVRAVTMAHSETSTGVLHDVREIARAVREVAPEVLVIVDAVTSLGVTELRPRAWDLDVVVSGSQKGVMLPPGLSFAWLSERAWSTEGPKTPSFSLDLRSERERQRNGTTGTTPAVSLIAGLDVALSRLRAVAPETLWATRARRNAAVLAAGLAVGARPFAERPSPAVAALEVPAGLDARDVVAAFARRGVRIGGGQDHIASRVIRPSVLGWADDFDVLGLAGTLEAVLREGGADAPYGAGPAAAARVLDQADGWRDRRGRQGRASAT